jgi:hypothetical protein
MILISSSDLGVAFSKSLDVVVMNYREVDVIEEMKGEETPGDEVAILFTHDCTVSELRQKA